VQVQRLHCIQQWKLGAVNTHAVSHGRNSMCSSSSRSVSSSAANSLALRLLVPTALQAGTWKKVAAAAMAAMHFLQQHQRHAPGCTTAHLQSSKAQAAVAL
jgi:hydroxymethylglutaryl-CoA reductase